MKKINPDLELAKIRSKKDFDNKSSFKNLFIPIFIFCFALLALIGVSFSSNVMNDNYYTVNVEIINGYEKAYVGKFAHGKFEDYILSPNNSFESINCSSGDLKYDSDRYMIYDDKLTQDTNCIISFKSNIPVGLDYSDTKKVYDNFGISYIFNDNSNNYFKYNELLFRIIRINGNGSLRLILDKPIGKFSYNDNETQLLNWYFLLNDTTDVILSDFDYDIAYEFNEFIDFDSYDLDVVGLPNVNEMSIYGSVYDNMLLSNKYINGIWGIVNYNIQVVNYEQVLDLRPVINVKVNYLSGDGTEELPYEIVK